jgi:uncharacterized membrane protein YeiH
VIEVPTLLFVVEVVAVLACAFSGFAEAQRKDMDLVGVYVVAFITAFGGGTLRDVLLDRRPFFWVDHQQYPILILALTLIVTPLMRIAHRIIPNLAFVVADAIGLGFFSITGVALALDSGMSPFVASVMGVVTGVFGGVLRDVVLNEVPMVLRDGRPYAIAAFLGCWLYILMVNVGVSSGLALWTAAGATTGFRLLAWRYNWSIKGANANGPRA